MLRLLRQLPVNEGLGGLDIAAGLEHRDRLRDGGDALLREHEVDRRALRLGVERHVFDDDAVGLLAARHRLDHGAIALAGDRAVPGQRLEVAPAEFPLLHHRADMDRRQRRNKAGAPGWSCRRPPAGSRSFQDFGALFTRLVLMTMPVVISLVPK